MQMYPGWTARDNYAKHKKKRRKREKNRIDSNSEGSQKCEKVLFLCSVYKILGLCRLTGASVNPARTFGPALISGFWEFHWLYWAAPILGGIIAGLIMNYVFVKKAEQEA